jgi:hypothetical protein
MIAEAAGIQQYPTTPIAQSDSTDPSFWDKSKSFLGDNWMNILGGTGLALSAIAPAIANKNMKDNLERSANVNAYAISPGVLQENLVNRQQIERNLANQAATTRQAAATSAGGDAGALMNSFTGIGTGTANALANAMLQSDVADQAEKARVQQGRLSMDQFNSQQQMRADDINAANEAAYYDALNSYTAAQGQNWANVGKSMFNYMQATKYADELAKAMKFRALNPNTKTNGNSQ